MGRPNPYRDVSCIRVTGITCMTSLPVINLTTVTIEEKGQIYINLIGQQHPWRYDT